MQLLSALEAFRVMRSINLLFTYLPTYFTENKLDQFSRFETIPAYDGYSSNLLKTTKLHTDSDDISKHRLAP